LIIKKEILHTKIGLCSWPCTNQY